MSLSVLSLSRRHVLGDLYSRCDRLKGSIPVYLSGEENSLVGHADESSLGEYSDALTFHLADDVCKKLSSGHFIYSLEFDHADRKSAGSNSRIRLASITLTGRKPFPKPVAKANGADEASS